MSIFSMCSQNSIEGLQPELMEFKPDELILKRGIAPDGLFCIFEGLAFDQFVTDDGEKLGLQVYQPGDALPISGFMANSAPSFDVRTLGKVKACFIKKSKLDALQAADSGFGMSLQKFLAVQLQQIKGASQFFRMATAEEKVVRFLGMVGAEYGRMFQVERSQIAAICGLSSETVSRILTSLEGAKSIQRHGRSIEILNDAQFSFSRY